MEKATDGIVRSVVECLLPTKAVKHDDRKLPDIVPMANVDETHEICSLFNGPVISGALDDINTGTIGVIQPLAIPADRLSRLTVKYLQIKIGIHLDNNSF